MRYNDMEYLKTHQSWVLYLKFKRMEDSVMQGKRPNMVKVSFMSNTNIQLQ